MFELFADPSLPLEINWFQRTALGSALFVVLVELEPASSRAALDELPDPELTERLLDALQRLGLMNVVDPDAADAGGPPNEDPEGDQPQPQHGAMDAWCRDPRVVAAIRRAAETAWSSRDATWKAWWRQRFAATVGAVFLEAAGRAAPDLDTTDLTIDVDPRGLAQSDGIVEVWISELAPGGNGHVEQVQRVLLEDPKRFARLLDGVLEDNEYERLDRDIGRFLELDLEIAEVRSGSDAMRRAWDQGHAAVAEAFGHLRVATAAADAEFARPAWTTIVNRMLGPGAHADLPSTVRRLMAKWEAVESAVSLEVPTRVFGALCADDEALDPVFRLYDNPSRYRRSRAIGSFFWPRGGAATRIQLDAGNAFGLLPGVDQAMVRDVLGAGPRVIEIATWDEDVERLVHLGLIEDAYVIVRFPTGNARLARTVMLQLQLVPIDLGALLAYPRVVGVWRRNGAPHMAVLLDEAVA
jgi:hypothetical protein